MRFTLEEDTFLLHEIGDVEWFMLMQLPNAADFRQSEKGRERLIQAPTADETAADFVADWRDYVQPEIETQFTRDIATVAADLRLVESVDDDDPAGGKPMHRLRLPKAHAETWYSVLNQARIILNEDHRIAKTERQLLSGERSPTELGEKKWLVMVQYRVYAQIQEFILSRMMEDI